MPEVRERRSKEEDVILRVLHGTQIHILGKLFIGLFRLFVFKLLFLFVVNRSWMSKGPYAALSGKRL